MNVNLLESVQERINDHMAVMRGNDYDLTGAVALVAEDQATLPGSYQVWLQVRHDNSVPAVDLDWDSYTWVWVNVDGEVVESESPIDA